MQISRRSSSALVASLTMAALVLPASPAFGGKARKQSTKAPLLKSLTYTPLTTTGSDGFLQARWTATVKLSRPAPSITFTILSTSSKNVETEAGPEKSYSAGVHKVSFESTALPGGTYKVTLLARVRPPKYSNSLRAPAPLKSSDPATLIVAEATEGKAGTGSVTKI